MPILQPIPAESGVPLPVVHRFDRRAGGAAGPPDPAPRSARARHGTEAVMKLSELLEEEDFLLGAPSRDKRSALEAVASMLGRRTGRSQGEVLNALLRRERLGSTATGDGLAMPHAALAGIWMPAAVIATMKHPVAFDAPDDEDVDILLGLLWPSDVGGFLLTLSQSSRLLRRPGFRDLLRQATSPAKALAGIEAMERNYAAAGHLASAGAVT
ncbi:PTS sugar transporter subunit IIA [Mesorhizobium sp. CAU 1732]|uniref:PTS sugar transporter subunit IIA n=1 Tax=Mesorhizobium sp. CAU 1732 TaxID=3140358 RepID=UPI003261BFCF